jgi:hypothetical protein
MSPPRLTLPHGGGVNIRLYRQRGSHCAFGRRYCYPVGDEAPGALSVRPAPRLRNRRKSNMTMAHATPPMLHITNPASDNASQKLRT